MKKVMKGILIIAIVCMVLISLSGCARVNYEVNVNKDGSADVSYVMGYDKEFLNSMGVSESDVGEEGFADMEKEATEDGYQVEKYNDDIIVYPGHGKDTILGREKKNNIYFNEFYDRI